MRMNQLNLLEKFDAKIYQFGIRWNRYFNKFGIYLFDSIQVNLNKINKEINEFLNNGKESLHTIRKGAFLFVLDGYKETYNEDIKYEEIHKFEKLVTQLPSYHLLKRMAKKKGMDCQVDFIHSAKDDIFKGLYIRFS